MSFVQGVSNPNIIIRVQPSIDNFSPVGEDCQFGIIIQVYAGCDAFGEGEYVYFDTTKAKMFSDSNQVQYYVVNKEFIYFTENIPIVS